MLPPVSTWPVPFFRTSMLLVLLIDLHVALSHTHRMLCAFPACHYAHNAWHRCFVRVAYAVCGIAHGAYVPHACAQDTTNAPSTQAPFSLPPVPKSISVDDFTLVVARCKEDVAWLRGFIHAFSPKTVYVYEHCNYAIDGEQQSALTAGSTAQIVDVALNPNTAFECHCYLKFIVSQYNQLPSLVMFLQVTASSLPLLPWVGAKLISDWVLVSVQSV